MRERLREVTQRLAAGTGLLRIEAEMVGVAEHLLEQETGVFETLRVGAPGPRQSLDQPERTHVERAFGAFQPVGSLAGVIAIDQSVGGQATLGKRLANSVDCREHPRVVGAMKNTSGISRFDESSAWES